MTTLQHRPMRADLVIAQGISGNLVLLNIPSGLHYSLNDLGARVWTLCDGGRTVEEIIDALLQEYEAPVDRVREDVLTLMQELATEQLLK